MRTHGWVLAALALATPGCHQRSEPKPLAPAAGAQAPTAPEATAPAPAQEPAPLVVTPQKLDAYLRYQQATLALFQKTLKGLRKLEGRADGGDAQLAALAGKAESFRLVQAQEAAEEQARQQVGLSQTEIIQLQALVGDVILRRRLAATLHLDDQLTALQKLRDQVPAEQRQTLDASIAALQQQQAQNESLVDARKAYGDANVDAVLAREKDLAAAYQRWIQTFAPPAR